MPLLPQFVSPRPVYEFLAPQKNLGSQPMVFPPGGVIASAKSNRGFSKFFEVVNIRIFVMVEFEKKLKIVFRHNF